MTDPAPPALSAPAARPLIDRAELRRLVAHRQPMGNQPALDGLRAVSVALVVAYHAGLDGVHGGFLGVEVFFVVSGYLITTLLLDEHRREGCIGLRTFWVRRARRLLPALYVMIAAVTAWALVADRDHVAQLRRDLLPALLYVGNWGQVFGSIPYFSTADPLLRHVWSLAVEEQWYLLWPLAFVVLVRVTRARWRVAAAMLAACSVGVMVASAVVAGGTGALTVLGDDVDRFNLLYLGTASRSSGLLLGAALAFAWRPWDRPAGETGRRARGVARTLDTAGVLATAAIVVIAATRSSAALVEAGLYRIWLPAVTVLSAVAIASIVAPGSVIARRALGWRPLVALGRRSYGIYLWHWPVFVLAGARTDEARLPAALLATAVLSEVCYRYVETPVRRGVLGGWWRALAERGAGRRRLSGLAAGSAVAAIVAGLAVPVVAFDERDPAVDTGGAEVVFDPMAAVAPTVAVPTTVAPPARPTVSSTGPGAAASTRSDPTSPGPAATAPSTTAPRPTTTATTLPPTTTTLPTLPRGVTIVGDSQAHSLAVNLPTGIDQTFRIADGAVSGCGVWAVGSIVTARDGFGRRFDDCAGWEQRWGRAVQRSGSELALVVIGAWDLFDLRVGDLTVVFGTPDADALFLANLQRGIDAIHAAGAHAALLEVACMRPEDVAGAGVPALPERGDDARVAHLNDLLREAAAADPAGVTFVEGPDAWCTDPAVSTDRAYRWDGVHVYRQGAKLIFETIAAALLSIPL